MKKKMTGYEKRVMSSEKAVTVLELLTVLSIIVVLVSMGIVEFNRVDDRAYRNAALVSSRAIADSLRMYKQERRKYTCSINDLLPYTNLTSLRKTSFLTVLVDTDDCTFQAHTYVRITAVVKGITPSYLVNYHVYPSKEPECSANGATPYPCTQKW